MHKESFLFYGLLLLSKLFFSTSLVFAQTPFKTVFLGDVEGQGERLESFFQNSPAFKKDRYGSYVLKSGYQFVFLGDAVDKGDNSLKILRHLVHLKESFPERVHLIAGNRDLNKLHIPHFFTQKNKSIEDFMNLLEKKMGSSQIFENRRKELQRVFNTKTINDLEVVESFRSDFRKNGFTRRYLELSSLTFLDVSNKTLFLHGGLTKEAYGHIPGIEGSLSQISDWLPRLNQWAKEHIIDGLENKSGAPELIRYQEAEPGLKSNQKSVVYGRNFSAETALPEMIPESLQKKLIKQGINTLVVGHTPVGDIPVVISNGQFRIIFTDNSHATHKDSASLLLHKETLSVSARLPHPGHRKIHIQYRHRLGEWNLIGQKNAQGWIVGLDNKSQPIRFHVDKEAGFKATYQSLPRPPAAILCRQAIGQLSL